MMSTSRTLPETVGWVRQEGLALNLPTDRLAFLIAIKTLSEDESDPVSYTHLTLPTKA